MGWSARLAAPGGPWEGSVGSDDELKPIGGSLGCVFIGLGFGPEVGPFAFVVDADDLDNEDEVAIGHGW